MVAQVFYMEGMTVDTILEKAIKGEYNGKPAKYVLLYHDMMDAGIEYKYVSGFQMALYKGELIDWINSHMRDTWVRP